MWILFFIAVAVVVVAIVGISALVILGGGQDEAEGPAEGSRRPAV